MTREIPIDEVFVDKLEPKILRVTEVKNGGATYIKCDDFFADVTTLGLSRVDYTRLRGAMYLRVTVEAVSAEEGLAAERQQKPVNYDR